MKNKKPLLIVGIILLLTLIAILLINKNEQTFKIISFSNNNGVRNSVDREYLDTIVQVGLGKLDIKGVTVLIQPMKADMEIGDYNIEAYIVGNNKQYIIFINPAMSRDKSIEVLSHEIIHLFQTEKGQLQKTMKSITWEGRIIQNPGEIEYGDRPWEREAFTYGRILEREIRKELIK